MRRTIAPLFGTLTELSRQGFKRGRKKDVNRLSHTLISARRWHVRYDKPSSRVFPVRKESRREFFWSSTFTSKSMLKEVVKEEEKKPRMSTELQTGLLVSVLGTLLVAMPRGIVYFKEHYAQNNESFINSNLPDVYEDIDFIDDEMLSGLSTRVILDYIFENEPRNKDDDNVLHRASAFLSKVIYNDKTEAALKSLVVSVLKSEEMIKEIRALAASLFQELIVDQRTKDQVVELVKEVVAQESVKKAVTELIIDLLRDDEIFEKFLDLISRIFGDESVKESVRILLTNAAHETLIDEGIVQHTKEFAASLVADSTIQRTSGDALWNTIGYSLSPSEGTTIVLVFVGVLSLALGFFALTMSNASVSLPETSQVITTTVKKVPDPSTFISSTLNIFMYPFRILLSTVRNVEGWVYEKLTSYLSFGLKATKSYFTVSSKNIQQATTIYFRNLIGKISHSFLFVVYWTEKSSRQSLILVGNYTLDSFHRCQAVLIDIWSRQFRISIHRAKKWFSNDL